MKTNILIAVCMTVLAFSSCKEGENKTSQTEEFKFFSEQFADIKILRYQVPDFDSLSLNQKKLLYFLSKAAIAGRDIIYDQNGKYNLAIRRTLENIVESYKGDRDTSEFTNLWSTQKEYGSPTEFIIITVPTNSCPDLQRNISLSLSKTQTSRSFR
ncbi:MAG: hypothetical protein HC830_08710 [Bacteroidetes bacterium]|nr:hypothetical protein [Bacteroidota bacterium]